MYIYIITFMFLSLFSFVDFAKKNQQKKILVFISIYFVLFIGLRGETGADSLNYINFFKYNTDTIWNWKGVDKGYAEYGFYYLSVLLKSIWNDINFYFICISLFTIIFLYKILKEYSIYPILGFITYYSRFLIVRDMNQIRQALAMVIIIWGFKYLLQDRKFVYMTLILLCSLIHYSSLIVLPFILFYKYKNISMKKLSFLVLSMIILGILVSSTLKVFLLSIDSMLMDRYVATNNLGLLNPVLLFQVLMTFLFFYFEPILKSQQNGYYLIRNAYLYSTIILILTCNMGEIGGRLATIFATCEIFIIPAMVRVIRPYSIGYIISLILVSLLFSMNYMKFLNDVDLWKYTS